VKLMSRRSFILSAVLLVTIAGLGIYLLIPPTPGVTLQNFRRLEGEMMIEDFDRILGYENRIDVGDGEIKWVGEEGTADVYFRTQRWPGTAIAGTFFCKDGRYYLLHCKTPALGKVLRWFEALFNG